MTESEVIDRIRQEVKRVGSQKKLAEEWGVTISYINDLLQGRRSPGPKILIPLGLRRVTVIDYQSDQLRG